MDGGVRDGARQAARPRQREPAGRGVDVLPLPSPRAGRCCGSPIRPDRTPPIIWRGPSSCFIPTIRCWPATSPSPGMRCPTSSGTDSRLLVGRFVDLVAVLKLFMLLGLGLTAFRHGAAQPSDRRHDGPRCPCSGVPFLFHSGYAKGFLGFNVAIGSRPHCHRPLARRQRADLAQTPGACLARLDAAVLRPSGALGHLWHYPSRPQACRSACRTGARRATAVEPWLLRLLRDGTQALPPLAILGDRHALAADKMSR